MNGKRWMVLMLLLGTASLAFGQGVSVLELRGGYLDPKDTKSGLIFGGSYGVAVDERVDISLGFDVFHRNYTEETAVADTNYISGVNETTVMRELEYNTTLLPIHADVTIRFPFEPPLYWFFSGGISYRWLFNKEDNYQEGISEKRTYHGLGWRLRAGIEYTIGSRSSVIFGAMYNIGKVSRNREETTEGLPVWNEVDISGFGFFGGLRLEFY